MLVSVPIFFDLRSDISDRHVLISLKGGGLIGLHSEAFRITREAIEAGGCCEATYEPQRLTVFPRLAKACSGN